MSCAVFSLTTSVSAPYFSSKFGAVLIKYSASHTILKFSLRFGRSCQSKDRYPPEYGVKPMLLVRSISPFVISVKLIDFLHTIRAINYLSLQR